MDQHAGAARPSARSANRFTGMAAASGRVRAMKTSVPASRQRRRPEELAEPARTCGTPPERRRAARRPFLVLAACLLAGCGGEEAASSADIRPVRYARAFVVGTDRIRTFAGVARAASEQDLAFRVAGTVTAVEVAVGSRVRRGQVLARLDSGDLELRRQQAEAGVAQARAQARNARATYERVAALYGSGNASMSDLDAARATYESANASEASAATALRLAEQQVSYALLQAPVDGSVSRVAVDVNEAVGAGQTVVVVIDTGGSPEVQVTVPETFIANMRAGRPAEVAFATLAGGAFGATVTEVGTAAAGAGGFPVTVRLDAQPNAAQVRPGMAAEVTFRIEGRPGAAGVLVPPEAVGQDQRGRFVYVLAPPDTGNVATAERRTVETGALTPEGLEILDGVQDGEYVATAGLATLAPGQRVRLLDAR